MSENEDDDVLAWDEREEFRGIENEHFRRPSRELIEYARANHLHMNLWSCVVQRMLQLRMQQGWTRAEPKPDVWLPWGEG